MTQGIHLTHFTSLRPPNIAIAINDPGALESHVHLFVKSNPLHLIWKRRPCEQATGRYDRPINLLVAFSMDQVNYGYNQATVTIFINLGLFRHFETVTNIRTWIK
jgi:hypothetical protein